MLMGDILRASARRAPAAIALSDGARTLSYGDFDADSDRLSAALTAAGFAKGDRVGVMMTNRIEYALLFFAAARAGVVLTHLSTRSTPREIAHLVAKVGIRALVVQDDFVATCVAAEGLGAAWERLIVVGGEADDFQALMRAGGQREPPTLSPDDLLAINFTGGTTGRPKGVAVSHRARVTSALSASACFGIDADDVCVVATPMFHAVGLYVWFGAIVGVGATAVLMPGWDADRFLATAERHAATAALFVPTQLSDILRVPSFAPERLAAMRHVHHAGAPMPVALVDRLEAALPWATLSEHYGQSETGPVTLRPPEFNRSKRGSIGIPVPGVEARIVDAAGRPCPPGAIGELVTRGAHVLAFYWDDREETRHAFRYGDGWLATGDLGTVDADGFITLVDRAKDMIVSGGENIYPAELENALFRHPAVADCAVFGIPDDHWGEVPAAHVVLREGLRASAQDLIAHVEREVVRWKRPRLVEFVAALPRTAVGKTRKDILREPYWRSRQRRI
jgi:fatty-acyl-CoA synthase